MALTLPEAEGWNAGLVPPYSSWGSGWECPLRQPWAPGGGSTRLWVWACECGRITFHQSRHTGGPMRPVACWRG